MISSVFRESLDMEFQWQQRHSVGTEMKMSYDEKVRGWRSTIPPDDIQNQAENTAALEGENKGFNDSEGEIDEYKAYQDSIYQDEIDEEEVNEDKADEDEIDEDEDDEDEEDEDEVYEEANPPELEQYLAVITASAAYDWLLSKLRQELLFHVSGDLDARDMISKEVLSQPIFRQVSRKLGPPRCEVLYETDWNPLAFFQMQDYHEEDYHYSEAEAFSRVLTLTGVPNEAEGLSCGEYLCQTWPQTGRAFLELMEMHLGSGDEGQSRGKCWPFLSKFPNTQC